MTSTVDWESVRRIGAVSPRTIASVLEMRLVRMDRNFLEKADMNFGFFRAFSQDFVSIFVIVLHKSFSTRRLQRCFADKSKKSFFARRRGFHHNLDTVNQSKPTSSCPFR
jgi:hypothetical protein